MAKDFDTMENSNCSSNPSIHDVSPIARRTVLKAGAFSSLAALLTPLASMTGCAAVGVPAPKLGFKGIPVGLGDKLVEQLKEQNKR